MSTVTAVPIAPVKRSYVVWLIVGIIAAVMAAACPAHAFLLLCALAGLVGCCCYLLAAARHSSNVQALFY